MIEIELGETPEANAYDTGVENGRKLRTKYKTEDIARFVEQMRHKSDDYTRGFIKGLKDG